MLSVFVSVLVWRLVSGEVGLFVFVEAEFFVPEFSVPLLLLFPDSEQADMVNMIIVTIITASNLSFFFIVDTTFL